MKSLKLKAVTGLTLLNGACGCLSIMAAFSGDFMLAVWFLVLSVVSDQLDGRTARALGVASDIGRELDSLSDAISFGVAPMMILYLRFLSVLGYPGMAICVIFALAAIYRLAKFNITEVKTHFLGVATPVSAALVMGLTVADVTWDARIIAGLALLFSYLMVSNIPYFNFKNANKLSVGEKALIAVEAAVILGLLVFEPMMTILGIVFVYVFLTPVFFRLFGKADNSSRPRGKKTRY